MGSRAAPQVHRVSIVLGGAFEPQRLDGAVRVVGEPSVRRPEPLHRLRAGGTPPGRDGHNLGTCRPALDRATFVENQKGVSFDRVLGAWLDGAADITLTDQYILAFHQVRNLMEILEVIALLKPDGEDVRFRLLTSPDPAGRLKNAADIAALTCLRSWEAKFVGMRLAADDGPWHTDPQMPHLTRKMQRRSRLLQSRVEPEPLD